MGTAAGLESDVRVQQGASWVPRMRHTFQLENGDVFADLKPGDVAAAAERIRPVVVRTPLRRSGGLSEVSGVDVWLKLETEQVTGSFKLRGAANTLSTLSRQHREIGVVASSAGNHGLGVAFAARREGVPATIYVPHNAPNVKKDGIAALGASIIDSAPDYDAAMVLAKRHAAQLGAYFINPCVGDPLIAGQGTVALEVFEELPDLATMVVPVGGGGLLGGTGVYLRGAAPHVRIVGAQSELTAAMSRSLAADRLVEIPSVPTLADGLAGQIDAEALDIGRYALDEMLTVTEHELARAIAWLHHEESVTAEGAGAVGVAAVLGGKIAGLTGPVAIVVSGGNIDDDRLGEILG